MTSLARHGLDRVPAAAFNLTVASLFKKQARIVPTREALVAGARSLTYLELDVRTDCLARALAQHGAARGERIALLSENRLEYLECELAAAKLGAVVACLNWRLTDEELAHCVQLVSPVVLLVSPRYARVAQEIRGQARLVEFGSEYERLLEEAPLTLAEPTVDAEDPLLILYTSGTTGMPKGAVVSHRAMIARMHVFRATLSPSPEETFVAWAPMFHMISTDFSLGTMMFGGTVVACDGPDMDVILSAVATRRLSWLVTMPGMTEQLIAALKERRVKPRGVRAVGVMADLVPRHHIAELTKLLDAPYLNSFGSTEAGLAPASGNLLPIGIAPTRLSKEESSLCDICLVDNESGDVPDGQPGELLMRGPTLFSGYWDTPELNKNEFRGGWFHTGDLFSRNGDGSLEYVDRVKYLIKTGGENVYPAELEQILMSDHRVEEAVVVRRFDTKWGEVPIAFVVCNDESVTAHELLDAMDRHLARYKRPKEIRFVTAGALPRSTTGKVLRHEVERTFLGESGQSHGMPRP